jgi:hypothetical protein
MRRGRTVSLYIAGPLARSALVSPIPNPCSVVGGGKCCDGTDDATYAHLSGIFKTDATLLLATGCFATATPRALRRPDDVCLHVIIGVWCFGGIGRRAFEGVGIGVGSGSLDLACTVSARLDSECIGSACSGSAWVDSACTAAASLGPGCTGFAYSDSAAALVVPDRHVPGQIELG